MGTDKNDDVLYVGNSWAGTLAKINTRTQETTTIPLPDLRKPYHVAVDSQHNAWLNIWMTDQVLKYDPVGNSFTAYDLPTRGSEVRYVSLYEKDGQMKVVLPSYRTRKVSVMAFRSEADLQAAKAQAAQ
jgi:streptogramin lyase